MTEPESGGKTNLSLNLAIAFGFCAQPEPVVDADGRATWTYRALPPALWHQDWGQTLARIEKAAETFSPGDEIPFRDLPFEIEPREGLTERGLRFFEGLPLYAEFSIYSGFRWRQYDPNGELAFSADANQYHGLVRDVTKLHPIQRWAEWFFAPFRDMLPTGSKGETIAIAMVNPAADAAIKLPSAHEWERFEMPWGPWKVLAFACAEHRVDEFRDLPEDAVAQLVETTMAVLPKDGWEIEWKRHWVWRFDVPAVIVPRMLYWVQMNGLGHQGLWANRAIHPGNRWKEPQATYQADVERFGYRMTCHLWVKLDELDAERRKGIESDMRRIAEEAASTLASRSND